MRSIGWMRKMNAAETLARATGWSRLIEDREAARSGQPLREARKAAARSAGVTPSTLHNLRAGRLKTIAAHVYQRLAVAAAREIDREIRALEHELEIARAAGARIGPCETEAILADIARLRAALKAP